VSFSLRIETLPVPGSRMKPKVENHNMIMTLPKDHPQAQQRVIRSEAKAPEEEEVEYKEVKSDEAVMKDATEDDVNT